MEKNIVDIVEEMFVLDGWSVLHSTKNSCLAFRKFSSVALKTKHAAFSCCRIDCKKKTEKRGQSARNNQIFEIFFPKISFHLILLQGNSCTIRCCS